MKKISELLYSSENKEDKLLERLVSKLEEYISIEEILVDIYKKNDKHDFNDEIEYKIQEEDGKFKIQPSLDLNKYEKEFQGIKPFKSISDLRRFIIRYHDVILENMLIKNQNFNPSLITLGRLKSTDLMINKKLINELIEFLLKDDESLRQDMENTYTKELNEKYENIKNNILSKVEPLLEDEDKNKISEKLKKDGIILGENTNLEQYKEYVIFASKLNKDILLDENFSFHLFFSLNKELEYYYDNPIEIIDKLYKELNEDEFLYFYKSNFFKNFVNKFYLLNNDEENVFDFIKYFFNLQKEYSQDISFITEKYQINFILNNKTNIKKILDAGLIYSIKNFFGIDDKKLSGVINAIGIEKFIYNIDVKNNKSFIDNLSLFLKGELESGLIFKEKINKVDVFVEKFA